MQIVFVLGPKHRLYCNILGTALQIIRAWTYTYRGARRG